MRELNIPCDKYSFVDHSSNTFRNTLSVNVKEIWKTCKLTRRPVNKTNTMLFHETKRNFAAEKYYRHYKLNSSLLGEEISPHTDRRSRISINRDQPPESFDLCRSDRCPIQYVDDWISPTLTKWPRHPLTLEGVIFCFTCRVYVTGPQRWSGNIGAKIWQQFFTKKV